MRSVLFSADRRARQDGHDRRHQRAARTQRRAHCAGDDRRLQRRAANRIPSPAQDLCKENRAARAAVRGGRAGQRAGRCKRCCDPGARRRRAQAGAGESQRGGRRGMRDRVYARIPVGGGNGDDGDENGDGDDNGDVYDHGYGDDDASRHPAHERLAASVARELGFTQVSTSHETSKLIKLVARGDTTVVDAYLSPILRRYVEQVGGRGERASAAALFWYVYINEQSIRLSLQVSSELGKDVPLQFMQSNGGLTDAALFQVRREGEQRQRQNPSRLSDFFPLFLPLRAGQRRHPLRPRRRNRRRRQDCRGRRV